MPLFLIFILTIVAICIIAHLRIRSYLNASISAMFLGPLIVCIGFYIITGFDGMVGEYLPGIIIVLTIVLSPVPFVIGLGVRLARRHHRESNGNCIKCGNKLHDDITIGCTKCGWKEVSIQKGLCPICTYDLRSNFSTGCPECGWRREAEVDEEVSLGI